MDNTVDLADPIARILDMVADTGASPGVPSLDEVAMLADVQRAQSFEDLPAAWRAEMIEAGRGVFFQALKDELSVKQATDLAAHAARSTLDRLARAAAGTPEDEPAPSTLPALAPAPKSTGKRGAEICEAGKARSMKDVAALRGAGFAMKETLFDRGTMVIDLGVANAKKARRDYEAMPLVADACESLTWKIAEERRRMVEVKARDVMMEPTGRILLGAAGTYDITEHGFDGLVERLGYGGGTYLAKCPPALRAHNVNAQRDLLAAAEDAAMEKAVEERWTNSRVRAPEPKSLALRVRDRAPSETDRGGPEVFAVVSTSYPTFDADQIATAFQQAMPADARGTVRYDPASTGTRFEALFHTTVAPEHFVCGEVFRTGIRVRANDSGDGSIVIRAVAFQNLCLNLIVIDRAGREIARIRHVGSVEKLRAEFEQAMAKAKGALAPFLRQWGYACEENLAAVLRADGVKLPTDATEIMRGIFAGVLASKKIRLPRVAGQGRAAQIDVLVDAWRRDESSATVKHHGVTRAAVVNAITRAAQGWIDALDPWATDALELDAARLLWGTSGERPAPLAFLDLDAVAEETDAGKVAPAQFVA